MWKSQHSICRSSVDIILFSYIVSVDITEVSKRVFFEPVIVHSLSNIVDKFIHCIPSLDLSVLYIWCSWHPGCYDFGCSGSLFCFFELSLKILNELIFSGTIGIGRLLYSIRCSFKFLVCESVDGIHERFVQIHYTLHTKKAQRHSVPLEHGTTDLKQSDV